MQKQNTFYFNSYREFLASCYHHSRFVDCRTIKQNTEVVVIYIYNSYLQQNGELILNISQVMTSKEADQIYSDIHFLMLSYMYIQIP